MAWHTLKTEQKGRTQTTEPLNMAHTEGRTVRQGTHRRQVGYHTQKTEGKGTRRGQKVEQGLQRRQNI